MENRATEDQLLIRWRKLFDEQKAKILLLAETLLDNESEPKEQAQ